MYILGLDLMSVLSGTLGMLMQFQTFTIWFLSVIYFLFFVIYNDVFLFVYLLTMMFFCFV